MTDTPPPAVPPNQDPPPAAPPPSDPPPADPPEPRPSDAPDLGKIESEALRDYIRKLERNARDHDRERRQREDAAKTEVEREREGRVAAESENAVLKRERLATQIATAKGLPLTFAARLQGDTREDMERDADELLKALGRSGSRAPVDFGSGSRIDGQPASGSDGFSATLRRAAGRS
jgi:hypothetical protein